VALFGLHGAGNIKSPAGQAREVLFGEIGGGPILVNRAYICRFSAPNDRTLTPLLGASVNLALPKKGDCASVRRNRGGIFPDRKDLS
jgi:hypothetical protein